MLLKREDKEYNDQILSQLNIPILESNDLNSIMSEFNEICSKPFVFNKIDKFSLETLINDIDTKIELFNKLVKE